MSASTILVRPTHTFPSLVPEVRSSTIQKPKALLPKMLQGKSITVGRLLSQVQPQPKQAILLGQCQDGLPILMGLEDPTMGAILVSGENSCGKTHQLQVMVDSAMRLHTPDELQISILTLHPEEWAYLKVGYQQQASIHAWYDHRSEKMIKGLSNLAEGRRDGKGHQTRHIMILDDLNFVEYLSYEAQMTIHWLLAYGSRLGFTMIATINSVYYNDYRYWIDIFRTRILGRTDLQEEADGFAIRPGSRAETLAPGYYCVWSEHDWLTYRLPLLGD